MLMAFVSMQIFRGIMMLVMTYTTTELAHMVRTSTMPSSKVGGGTTGG